MGVVTEEGGLQGAKSLTLAIGKTLPEVVLLISLFYDDMLTSLLVSLIFFLGGGGFWQFLHSIVQSIYEIRA